MSQPRLERMHRAQKSWLWMERALKPKWADPSWRRHIISLFAPTSVREDTRTSKEPTLIKESAKAQKYQPRSKRVQKAQTCQPRSERAQKILSIDLGRREHKGPKVSTSVEEDTKGSNMPTTVGESAKHLLCRPQSEKAKGPKVLTSVGEDTKRLNVPTLVGESTKAPKCRPRSKRAQTAYRANLGRRRQKA